MSRYRLTGAAERDLELILLAGIDQFGLHHAIAYHDGFTEVFDRLASFPRLYRLRSDFARPVRVAPHKAHVVVYRADDEDRVRILRVRHGREDWIHDPVGEEDL